MKENSKVIVSRTASFHGWGSDRYKWVSRLSKEERTALKTGTARVIACGAPACNGDHSITARWREIVFRAGDDRHYMVSPTPEIVAAIEKAI